MNPRTYYDLDFPPDSMMVDGAVRGSPLAIRISAPLDNGVLLDREQVANMIWYLQSWLDEQPVNAQPTVAKWRDFP